MSIRFISLLVAFSLFVLNAKAQVAYPKFQKHYVQEGETAASVADRFGVSLTDFCLLNDFPEEIQLQPGQLVLIKQLAEGEQEVIETPPSAKTETTKAKTEPAKSTAVKAESTKAEPTKSASAQSEPVKPAPTKAESTKSVPAKSEPAKPVSAKSETEETKATKPGFDNPEPVNEEPKAEEHQATETKEPEQPKTVTEKKEKINVKPSQTKEFAPVKKQEVAKEPFVVPPPSTNEVEYGPHGVVYKVSKNGYHVVQRYQTLFRVALIYGLSVEEIKNINGLSSDIIEIGQTLKVRKN